MKRIVIGLLVVALILCSMSALADGFSSDAPDFSFELPDYSSDLNSTPLTLSNDAPEFSYEVPEYTPEIKTFTLSNDAPEDLGIDIEYTPIQIKTQTLSNDAPAFSFDLNVPNFTSVDVTNDQEVIDFSESRGPFSFNGVKMDLPEEWIHLNYQNMHMFVRPSDHALLLLQYWNLDEEIAKHPELQGADLDFAPVLAPVLKIFLTTNNLAGDVSEADLADGIHIARAISSVIDIKNCILLGIRNHDFFELWITPGPISTEHTDEDVNALTEEVLGCLKANG